LENVKTRSIPRLRGVHFSTNGVWFMQPPIRCQGTVAWLATDEKDRRELSVLIKMDFVIEIRGRSGTWAPVLLTTVF